MNNKLHHLTQRYRYPLLLLVVVSVVLVFNVFFGIELNKSVSSTSTPVKKAPYKPVSSQRVSYWDDVKPILDRRCVVCHGCYDAPCQLKLSSPEGIDRGFSSEQVNAIRFFEVDPTRLFIDGKNTHDWRSKKKPFSPVLNERDQTPEANLQGSVFYKMLEQKTSHPLPDTTILPEKSFDFSLTFFFWGPLPVRFNSSGSGFFSLGYSFVQMN